MIEMVAFCVLESKPHHPEHQTIHISRIKSIGDDKRVQVDNGGGLRTMSETKVVPFPRIDLPDIGTAMKPTDRHRALIAPLTGTYMHSILLRQLASLVLSVVLP
jgi:hypothetical protein